MDIDNATGFEKAPKVATSAVPPSGVRYGDLLPLGAKARSYTRRFIPSNGTQFTYSTRVIRLELNGPMFLDPSFSYLMFDVEVGTSAVVDDDTVDAYINSAHDFIERIVITGPDGTELERVDNYAPLAEFLTDFEVPEDHILSFSQYTSAVGNTSANGTPQPITLTGPKTGSSTYGRKRKLALKLVSGLLSNKRYLPLLALRGSGLVLEIYLNEYSNAMQQVTAGTSVVNGYRLSNVEYVAHCVDFDEVFNRSFMSLLQGQGQMQWHGVTFHNFVYSTTLTGTTAIPIAERARSLKALYMIIRDDTNLNTITQDSLSLRTRAGISQYVFNIGGARFPQAPVRLFTNTVENGAIEGLMELRKSLGIFTDTQLAGRIKAFGAGAVYATTSSANGYEGTKFAIGLDLENFPADTNILESGFDTLSQALPIYAEISVSDSVPGYSTSTNRNIQVYSMVDTIYVLSADGLMSASD